MFLLIYATIILWSPLEAQVCDCGSSTIASASGTSKPLPPGVVAPLPASTKVCQPLQQPFNIDNPASWPLMEKDPANVVLSMLTASHLDAVTNPAVADYIVRSYNCRRSQVNPRAMNMLKMEWNQDAAVLAKIWGQKCSVNEHDPGSPVVKGLPCNQNLISSSPTPITWNSAIEGWHEEWDMFVYGDPGMLDIYHEIGHYTMMVWAKSFYLGCAWVNCSNVHNYICNQCPVGNAGDLSLPYESGNTCSRCQDNCEDGLCTKHCTILNKYSNCDLLDNQYHICSDPGMQSYALLCPATCNCRGTVY